MYKPTPEELSRILGAMPQGALQSNFAPEMPTMGQPLNANSAVVQPVMMAPQEPTQEPSALAAGLRAFGGMGGMGQQDHEQMRRRHREAFQQDQGMAPAESPYAMLLRELPGLAKAGMGAYDAWHQNPSAAMQPMPSSLGAQMQMAIPNR